MQSFLYSDVNGIRTADKMAMQGRMVIFASEDKEKGEEP